MALPIAGKISKLSIFVGTVAPETEWEEISWVPVLGRTDVTLNLNRGEIDAGHMDAEGWTNYLRGRKDATIDFSLRYLPDDAGQTALINKHFGDQSKALKVQFMMQEVEDEPVFYADAILTSLSVSAADESPQDLTGTMRINGPVVQEEVPEEKE